MQLLYADSTPGIRVSYGLLTNCPIQEIRKHSKTMCNKNALQ